MIEQLVTAISTFLSLLIALYALLQVKRARASIPSLDDFVWKEGEEWRCDERIGKLVEFFGSKMAHSLRQSMFQQMGVDQKLSKHVDRALSLDLLDNSGIGGILDLLGMGNTKKILANNPKTLGLILQRVSPLLGKYLQGNSPGQSGQGEM